MSASLLKYLLASSGSTKSLVHLQDVAMSVSWPSLTRLGVMNDH